MRPSAIRFFVRTFVAGFFLTFSAISAAAASLLQDAGWARATPPSAQMGAGFVTLRNDSAKDVRILSASSPVAQSVEIHTMSMEGGMMRMRQLEDVRVPAKGRFELQPGGVHFMLMGLKAPLREGETVQIALTLDQGRKLTLRLPVRSAAP